MEPWLCVPLSHRWLDRNWKRAISGCWRTTSRVANRVGTSTPLRLWAISETDMVMPSWTVWMGSGGRGRRADGCRQRGEVVRLTLEGLAQLLLQLHEAVRPRKGRERLRQLVRLPQAGVTAAPV